MQGPATTIHMPKNRNVSTISRAIPYDKEEASRKQNLELYFVGYAAHDFVENYPSELYYNSVFILYRNRMRFASDPQFVQSHVSG
jgi:hypothetical protein